MNRICLLLIFVNFTSANFGQIIADHSVVDHFDKIPEQYLNEVKKMWLSYAGESHSSETRVGLALLESSDATYAVSVTESGTPEAQTSNHLRASRATWGNLNNSTGWIYGYGEEDYCAYIDYPTYSYNSNATARTMDGLSYINTNGPELSAFGFGWCYDPGYNLVHSYLRATKEYIEHCKDNSISTTIFFTTGPVDSEDDVMAGSSERAYDNARRWQTIRDTVSNDETRVLFDYADILCYNDEGTPQTNTWDGHTYPVIHPDNMGGSAVSHIGSVGALRLGKAMWWMLARIAGWDGSVATGNEEVAEVVDQTIVSVVSGELRVEMKDPANLPNRVSIHNLQGRTVSHKDSPGSICSFSTAELPAGIYLVVISGAGINKTQKVFIK